MAVAGTALAAVAFMGVGLASMLQQHGVFSLGVGSMLLIYGALVALVALAGLKRWPLARGGLVASSLLHVMVGISTLQGSHAYWLLIPTALAAATLVGAIMPSTRVFLEGPDEA